MTCYNFKVLTITVTLNIFTAVYSETMFVTYDKMVKHCLNIPHTIDIVLRFFLIVLSLKQSVVIVNKLINQQFFVFINLDYSRCFDHVQ